MTHPFQSKEPNSVGWNLENTYSKLPAPLFASAIPTRVARPEVVVLNHRLAGELGLDFHSLAPSQAANWFSGNEIPPGSSPIAQAYAGHQFGGFTMLGDGRAILLGEQRTPNGALYDLQWKGSGPTKYSRRGDGRAALGPMLREYIISEAMHGLGVPTTRSLAVVKTGEPVYRETALPGAVLTRVAASHIRVGTFQYLAALQDPESLRRLADYSIERHYPELIHGEQKYEQFLHAVMERQSSLIAQWLQFGFVHGVMNTDNVAISGETIDYGPCAFLDSYHPFTVFSSIDHDGRYSFGNQPTICHWNIVRFGEAILPLLHEDQQESISIATKILELFPGMMESNWLNAMRRKLGLFGETGNDKAIADGLLKWMADEKLDYTATFRDLTTSNFSSPVYASQPFVDWAKSWESRQLQSGKSPEECRDLMRLSNPSVIPRNHRVEEALEAATYRGDLSVMNRLLEALSNPFEESDRYREFQQPPEPSEYGYQTFCGT